MKLLRKSGAYLAKSDAYLAQSSTFLAKSGAYLAKVAPTSKLKGQARGGQGPQAGGPHQEGGDIFRQEGGEESHVQVGGVVPESKDVVKG